MFHLDRSRRKRDKYSNCESNIHLFYEYEYGFEIKC